MITFDWGGMKLESDYPLNFQINSDVFDFVAIRILEHIMFQMAELDCENDDTSPSQHWDQ